MIRITAKYSAAVSDSGIAVRFVTSFPADVRREPAGFVCDINRFGQLRAIETLDLMKPAEVDVLSALNKETLSLPEQGEVMYDEEHEVFYLHLDDAPRSLAEKIERDLARGRGSDQKSCDGFLILDTQGRLLGIEVRCGPVL
jgi:hypothetical protein